MAERIKVLRQRRADLAKRGRDILAQADEDGNLNTELDAEYKDIEQKLESVNSAISREEAQIEIDRSVGAIEDDEPEQAARGSVPAQARNSEQFASFGEQLSAIAQAGINRSQPSVWDHRLQWSAASGANEAVPSEGGFLVQTDFSTQMLDMMHEMGDLLSRVRRIPLSGMSNGIKLPAIDETARTDGSRWGGVQAYWADEADTVAATKPKFRSIELRLNKLIGLGYATEELLQDSTALESVMSSAFVEEMTFKTEDGIVNGTGAGQPLGFLNSGAVVTVDKDSGQAAGTLTTNNVLQMWSRLPRRSRRNAVWLINQDVEPQLYSLTLGSGTAVTLLYQPPGSSGNADTQFGRLMGRPVVPVEQAATLGTNGDMMLVDLSQYLMTDKEGLRQASSMHVRFIYDEMTFRWTYRVDGQPAWRKPVTPFNGTNTQSPFITLQTRS